MRASHVDVYVDPVCPFAWLALRWLREVGWQRPIDLQVRRMSLAVLNGEDPVAPERGEDSAWRPARVGARLVAARGAGAWAGFVEAFGTRFHDGGLRGRDRVLREVCEELAGPDLDARTLYAAADVTDRDDDVRARHEEGMAPVGLDVGTPTLHVRTDAGTVAFFGPILERVPRGQDALDAFDGALLLARTPGFTELKRTRSGEIDFS
ncbi:disulfide bond formation protein DsbA [Actinomycetospora sp. NBRC 106375]|uniref:mycothiol-dependent nitroreductase Rv2466c family protein n=1 Tax=Actinomycetospora sp. NBRC 106375 TaxID=3032207 RepID=UPI0025545608|nr:disulfide bond formation protein DsbA [Actinomycetospora sp. NBRC 106375]